MSGQIHPCRTSWRTASRRLGWKARAHYQAPSIHRVLHGSRGSPEMSWFPPFSMVAQLAFSSDWRQISLMSCSSSCSWMPTAKSSTVSSGYEILVGIEARVRRTWRVFEKHLEGESHYSGWRV